MAIELFQINWSELYSFDKASNHPEAKESGVYALYKSIGGNKKLHYIGKSNDFMKRFGVHRQNTAHMYSETDLKSCYVTFGIMSSFDKSKMSYEILPEQLKDCESFLINELLPQGNDPSTKKGYKGSTIIIINSGKLVKPLKKVMIHNPMLEKLLKNGFKPNDSEDDDSYSF